MIKLPPDHFGEYTGSHNDTKGRTLQQLCPPQWDPLAESLKSTVVKNPANLQNRSRRGLTEGLAQLLAPTMTLINLRPTRAQMSTGQVKHVMQRCFVIERWRRVNSARVPHGQVILLTRLCLSCTCCPEIKIRPCYHMPNVTNTQSRPWKRGSGRST